MYQRSSRGHLVEILLFALSSLLLYHTGVGVVLFLVPLQVVASRRGIGSLAMAEAAFFIVFVVIRLWPTIVSPGHAPPDILGAIEIGLAGVLLLGMIVVNLPLRRRPRALVMVLAAAASVGLLTVPAVIWLAATPAFQQLMTVMSTEGSKLLPGMLAATGDAQAATFLTQVLRPDRLGQFIEDSLLRSLLADYAVLLTFSWWAGQAAANRVRVLMGATDGFRFSRFRLEGWWLWPLIVSGALVLADLFFGISYWAYAAWNIGLVLLFLFGLQGLAIVLFQFEKYRVPRLFWLLFLVGLAILARVGPFVVLAIPVLGISENWIRYRIPRETAPAE